MISASAAVVACKDIEAQKTRIAAPVCCNGWILIMASSHWAYLK